MRRRIKAPDDHGVPIELFSWQFWAERADVSAEWHGVVPPDSARSYVECHQWLAARREYADSHCIHPDEMPRADEALAIDCWDPDSI